MFKRAKNISLLVCLLLLICWGAKFCYLTKFDIEKYKTALKHKEEIAGAADTFKTSTHQMRVGVQKDIWFTQSKAERLHYRIQSQTSLLTLEPRGKKVEIIENLEKLKCWMQDKLYYSQNGAAQQQLRFFEADLGTYRYTSNTFEANTVLLSLYRLPNFELPPPTFLAGNAFMKGVAKDVSFSVSGKTPKFQAKQFQASLRGCQTIK